MLYKILIEPVSQGPVLHELLHKTRVQGWSVTLWVKCSFSLVDCIYRPFFWPHDRQPHTWSDSLCGKMWHSLGSNAETPKRSMSPEKGDFTHRPLSSHQVEARFRFQGSALLPSHSCLVHWRHRRAPPRRRHCHCHRCHGEGNASSSVNRLYPPRQEE
jgi:hypothetical protein